MGAEFNISKLIDSLQTRSIKDGNAAEVENVVASLAARIIAAQFGEELAFPRIPGSATLETPRDADANAEYYSKTGNISVDPSAKGNWKRMDMVKDATGPGYTGSGSSNNPTTEDVLNMVQTLRHELTHVKSPTSGVVSSYPMVNIQRYLPAERKPYDLTEMLRFRELPSMGGSNLVSEFLATAVPLSTADAKLGPPTREQRGYNREIANVLSQFPGLSKLITDMQRPELYKKTK